MAIIIGLGDMNEKQLYGAAGWFTLQEITTARQEQGVVGDLAGYKFFNYSGQTVDTVMNDRHWLKSQQLRAIPWVIAGIASESTKATAILGHYAHRGYRCAGYQRLERPFGH